MARILLVEDDLPLAQMVTEYLELDRHEVQCSADGLDGFSRIKNYTYDLLILDWQLPGMSGVDICRQLRSLSVAAPVLMLTSMSTISNKETGFDAGADDYLTKPFHIKELGVRVKALLRRPPEIVSDLISSGDIELNLKSHTVTRAGARLNLRPQEFNLLAFLMRHPGQFFTSEVILERVWHSDIDTSADSVRVHIKRLRDQLESDGGTPIIVSVRGLGYKFQPAVCGKIVK